MNIRFSSKSIVLALLSVTIVACTGQNTTPMQSTIPSWVLMPPQNNGITASSCSARSNDLMLDRRIATAMARSALAQQISIRVKAVDKLNAERTGDTVSQSFQSASEQVAEEVLNKSVIARIEEVTIDGVNQLCLLVKIEKNSTKQVFNAIYKATDLKLDSMQEEDLYAEFMKEQELAIQG